MESKAEESTKDVHGSQAMSSRKARHLEICLDKKKYEIEGGETGFEGIKLIHHSLPELDAAKISTSQEFLGYKVKLPLFISSMTGGSAEGFRVNKDLAKLAQEEKLAVGMGSIRILFKNPEVFPHFHLKALAPDVPVIANLGAVQIRDMVHKQIFEMLKRLEVDALAIHLNPGQELFQPEGDRDFQGILEAIKRFCQATTLPVIVKETGNGIHPAEVLRLLKAGVRYVNVAGSGGTNWIQVEAYRHAPDAKALSEAAEEFRDWGNPTGLILATLRHLEDNGRIPGAAVPPPLHTLFSEAKESVKTAYAKKKEAQARFSQEKEVYDGLLGGRVLASGGIRSGMDVVKSLVLGARLAGTALPLVRAVHQTGLEGGHAFVQKVRHVLEAAMVLSDCSDLSALRRAPYRMSSGFRQEVEDFSRLFV